MANLNRWIRETKGHCGTRGVDISHVKMSGGKYYIADEDSEEFHKMYAKDFDMGIRTMTISEIKTEHTFKMFFDIDVIDYSKLSDEYIMGITKILQEVLSRYFKSSEDLSYIISTTQSKKVVKKDEDGTEIEYTKTGVHVTFPYLNVDKGMALQLRYSSVLELEIKLGKRSIPTNPWSDVIDCAPYSGGLKMCGSVKFVKCDECKGKGHKEENKEDIDAIVKYRKKLYRRNETFDYKNLSDISQAEFRDSELTDLIRSYNDNTECDMCNGAMKIYEDRYYMPEFFIRNDGSLCKEETNKLKNSTFYSVKMTSIRCKSTDILTVNFEKPIDAAIAPRNTPLEMSDLSRRIQNLPPGEIANELMQSDIFKDDAAGLISWKGESVQDESIIKAIERCVRMVDNRYNRISVKTVIQVNSFRKVNKTITTSKFTGENSSTAIIPSYNIRVIGDGSNYCMNKGDNHNSCTCYFSLTSAGLKQKCFSKKDIVRNGGTVCSKYSSIKQTVPFELKKELFPEAKNISHNEDITSMVKRCRQSMEMGKKKKQKNNWDECIDI